MDKGPYAKKDSYTFTQKCDFCGTKSVHKEKDIRYPIDKYYPRSYEKPMFSCDVCNRMTNIEEKIPYIVAKRIHKSEKGVVLFCDNQNCGNARSIEYTKPGVSPTPRFCLFFFGWDFSTYERKYDCGCGTVTRIKDSHLEHSLSAKMREIDRDKRLEGR